MTALITAWEDLTMIHAIVPIGEASDPSQGLAMARSLASAMEMTVDLVTVHDGVASHGIRAELLDAHAASFPDVSRVGRLVRSGDPVTEILSLVSQRPGSILILSPRWSQDTESFAPDSLSARLIRIASCPILLATTDEWPRSLTLENVMVPVSRNAPAARQVLDLSRAFAHAQTVFRLVYVVTGGETDQGSFGEAPPPRSDSLEESAGYQARWRLLELAATLRRSGVRSTWELRHGDPAHEFARAATTTGANLVAIHSETGASYSGLEADQLALRVSHSAATPTLLLPSGYELSPTDNEITIIESRTTTN